MGYERKKVVRISVATVGFCIASITLSAGPAPLTERTISQSAQPSASGSNRTLQSGNDSTVQTSQDSVVLTTIPFETKQPDFGGEACVAMYLRSCGHRATQADVFNAAAVDPRLARGCVTGELVSAIKRIGLEPGAVWFRSDDNGRKQMWNQVLQDLRDGRPSVVCRRNSQREQFVLVTGFNGARDEVIFHDPNLTDGADSKLDRVQFLDSCRLNVVGDADQGPASQSVVCIRLAGNQIELPSRVQGFSNADFAQHIRGLKQRLPDENFHIVLQPPFVVVGDGTPEQVQRSATSTVKWAVESIKQDFFQKDPSHIIDIWLFKNPTSYQRHNKMLFNTKPTTPYGYYSPSNKVLVMDISTGGGTLVHEIVHPFMESNFPECPSWFNEGLASLYEQSSSRNGRIVGLTNWRLRGLQLAIEDGRLPSFKTLCSTSTREFYDGAGTNYAQARYLCYYLQEQGLLIKYFHAFKENVESDPTGYDTLIRVLDREDMETFQSEWEQIVAKLRFGR